MKVGEREFLFGCDPEGFLFDKVLGVYVGADGIVPGTKHQPYELPSGLGMVQVDGLALEFGITPTRTPEEFDEAIVAVLEEIQTMLPEQLEIRFQPTTEFSTEEMARQSWENLQLGCEPDYNAWTYAENKRPQAPKRMRSAGGHLHIGWDTTGIDYFSPEHFGNCARLVRLLDLHLGEASTAWDQDGLRRKLYGAPGSFRPKPYGLEYRPLSCVWVRSSELRRQVVQLAGLALEAYVAGEDVPEGWFPSFGGAHK